MDTTTMERERESESERERESNWILTFSQLHRVPLQEETGSRGES